MIRPVDVAGIAVTLLRAVDVDFVVLVVDQLTGVTINLGDAPNPSSLVGMLEVSPSGYTVSVEGEHLVVRVEGMYCGVPVVVLYERPIPEAVLVTGFLKSARATATASLTLVHGGVPR